MPFARHFSLRLRLLLAAALVVALHAISSIALDVHDARSSAHKQQEELGLWVVAGLSDSLANALVINDLATVQSTVERLFTGGSFLQLAVLDDVGRPIIDLRALRDTKPAAPGWFVQFLDINEAPSRSVLTAGGVQYGVVVALISPAATIEHAWAEVQSAIGFAFLAMALFWGAFTVLIELGMRPLAELSQVVNQIGQGDFTARANARDVPEFGNLVRVINLMTQQLTDLITRTREQAASEIQAGRLKDFHAITTGSQDNPDKLAALLEMGIRHFGMDGGKVAAQAYNALIPPTSRGLQAPCDVLELCAKLLPQDNQSDALALPDLTAEAAGVGAMLAAPVAFAGRAYGTVCFWRALPQDAAFHRVDMEFVNLIGQWMGFALEQAGSERQLWEEKERLLVTLASIGDAVVATDTEGRITFLNAIAEDLIAVPLSEAQGFRLDEICDLIHEHTRNPIPNPIMDCLEKGHRVELAAHGALVRRDGTECPIEDSAAPIFSLDGQIVGAVMVFRDVTESRCIANQMEHLASHDPLTNLPNRRAFGENLNRVLTGAKCGSNKTHALCFMDLDHFKAVNDTCGHAAGDALLQQVAHLFLENLRGTDVLARLGGDEFGLILAHVSEEQALETAERICTAVRDFNFGWGGRTFKIGASIGLALVEQTAQSTDELIRQADAACYAAKHGGRSRVCQYRADMEQKNQQS